MRAAQKGRTGILVHVHRTCILPVSSHVEDLSKLGPLFGTPSFGGRAFAAPGSQKKPAIPTPICSKRRESIRGVPIFDTPEM